MSTLTDQIITQLDVSARLLDRVERHVGDIPSRELTDAIRELLPALDPGDVNVFVIVQLSEEVRARRRARTLEAERKAEVEARRDAAEAERQRLAAMTPEQRKTETAERNQQYRWDRRGHGNLRKDGAAADGCPCGECEAARIHLREGAEREAERREQFNLNLSGLISEYEQSLRIKWTQELLDSTFAMPDGTTVAWGDATIDQHQARITMLTKNIAANTEAASRHQRAIRDLETHGVASLRSLP
ncbi:hypothetical protein QSJ19_19745 [Gordonia sp. ABSL11-1]|uniref:hypothetical protein n=1 Tax=Gordonia sp. ABSL11-1 TaxID=3053924 RepID=UPI002572B8BC|nr:hypothetical protein [Gordonia sp. ABSL11-1]MDL9947771.1 hypothetical protein [Gordonia sp. ABSL11-1]